MGRCSEDIRIDMNLLRIYNRDSMGINNTEIADFTKIKNVT